MDFDKICEYFGYFIIIIFCVFIFCKIFIAQTNIIEGLQGNSYKSDNKSGKQNRQTDNLLDINANLESINEKLHDYSRIDKYGDDYKALIQNLQENIILNIIYNARVIGTNISNGKELSNSANQKLIDDIDKYGRLIAGISSYPNYLIEAEVNKKDGKK